jgi:hypothetical protein
MTLSLTVGTTTVAPKLESVSYEERVDDRETCALSVVDAVGYDFQQDQPVTLRDTVTGEILYEGFVDKIDDQLYSSTMTNLRRITCKDGRWRAEKRYWTGQEFVNWTAGDVLCKMHQDVLAAEGVVAAYAMRHDDDTASWGQGALTGTTATNNTLTLANAGTDYTRTDSLTADFTTGTLTNVAGANNALQLASFLAIKYSGSAGANLDGNNLYAYRQIAKLNYTLQAGDLIVFDIWIDSRSPEIKAGIDLTFSDNTWMHMYEDPAGPDFRDQFIINADPKTDLKGWADDQWYSRTIPVITAHVGRTVVAAYLLLEGDQGGDYNAYFKNFKIINSTGTIVRTSIFSGADTTMKANVPGGSNGYFNLAAKVVTAYAHDGTRIAPARDISSVGIVKGSIISWPASSTAAQPEGDNQGTDTDQIQVFASVDGGATWGKCTNHAAIPGLLPGMSTAGKSILIKQALLLGGPDPSMTPMLDICSFTIYSAAAATKTDFFDFDNDQTSLGTGTLTNCTSYSDGLKTTGIYRNWNTPDISSQTLFGTLNPAQEENRKAFHIRVDSGGGVKSRFDFAGSWQNFILEIDIQLMDSTTSNYGVLYRTTFWDNNADTGGYLAYIDPTHVGLGRGTNSATDTFTGIASVALTLTVGAWYRMKIVVNGSSHKVFLNDVQYISVTDATFGATGNVGVRATNASGVRHSSFFDNFGIVGYEADNISVSNRITPALALSGIIADSRINWRADEPDTSDLLVESTLDNGVNWTACTNGGQIPSLASGYDATGKSLKIRTTMTNQAVNVPIALQGLSIFVLGQYSASGTRIAPPLDVFPAGTVGSSSISWDATTPAGTSVAVATSVDRLTSLQPATNGGPIANSGQAADLWLDDFVSDTSASYTSGTFGASPATWTLNAAQSRITGTGGDNATYLANSPSSADMTVAVIIDEADNAGLTCRYKDGNNQYLVLIYDDQATTFGLHSTLFLYAIASGVFTALTQQTISFPRDTPHRVALSAIGSQIILTFDGTQLYQGTDSSVSGIGKGGLVSGSLSRFYSLRVQPQGATALAGSYVLRAFGSTLTPETSLTGTNVYSQVTLTSTDPTVKPSVSSLVTSVRGPDIQTGALLPSTQYAYKGIATNYDDASSQSNMSWRIRQGRRLVMKDRTYEPAPWVLHSSDPLFRGASAPPTLTKASTSYRNRQYVTGAIKLVTIDNPPEEKVGDGTAQSWVLKYPVDSMIAIVLDGEVQTFGVQGTDTGKAFYYQAGESTFSQDSSLVPPTSAERLQIYYVAREPYTAMAENTVQQATLALIDTTSGIIEAVEDGKGMSDTAADALAQARLDQYGILGSFEWSYSTERRGLHAGQFQSLFVDEHGLLDANVLISGISVTPKETPNGIMYLSKVDVTSGPNLGVWQRLFSRA